MYFQATSACLDLTQRMLLTLKIGAGQGGGGGGGYLANTASQQKQGCKLKESEHAERLEYTLQAPEGSGWLLGGRTKGSLMARASSEPLMARPCLSSPSVWWTEWEGRCFIVATRTGLLPLPRLELPGVAEGSVSHTSAHLRVLVVQAQAQAHTSVTSHLSHLTPHS
jgi:hypothetical protein